MLTRNRGLYEKGYYKYLTKPNVLNDFEQKKRTKKKINEDSMLQFINEFNISVLKKLKSNSKQNKINICKVSINNSIYEMLQDKFNLNGKFKICREFTETFKIQNERFYNFNDYCTFPYLEIKINKGKIFKYFDKDLQEHTLQSFYFTI